MLHNSAQSLDAVRGRVCCWCAASQRYGMALHLAVDNVEAVKLLAGLGAGLHAKDNKGQTALQLAKVAKHAAVVAMLQHEMDKPRREVRGV